MISMEAPSKIPPAKIVDQAVAFFGPAGLGLETIERSDGCARFGGGGGFVDVTLTSGDGGPATETTVSVQGREFERQIREFVASL